MNRTDTHAAPPVNIDDFEEGDWVASLQEVLHRRGPDYVRGLLRELQLRAQGEGVVLPVTSRTPYVNSIPPEAQPDYPGDRELERRLKSLVRWNAMAMVVRANRAESGIGGHISTYASAATLYEVGFNHFFRGRDHASGGDLIFFQGHASPGIYARSFLEGRLSETQVTNFRQELAEGGGLSSYPHPWLMPDYWEFPTVSMGLGPITAIYAARFMRYLEHRGLKQPSDAKVWCFVGDGETDEPETLGAISLAAREKLDNLIFVINCNLQRLDGPVRGNQKIIQELEANFRGVGWNVLKVLWGSDWDTFLSEDHDGLLRNRMMDAVDGEYQKYRVEGGAYIREHFWGTHPDLAKRVAHLSDDDLWRMRLGGHDPRKVYTAYRAASLHEGQPTVILAKTIKGYGLGEAGEGKNITHQQKKLNEEELLEFRRRFDIPVPEDQVGEAPFYVPSEGAAEMIYLHERRKALGGFVPRRVTKPSGLESYDDSIYDELLKGSGDRPVATTMATVRILTQLLKDKDLGRFIVPIVPDEARTFGMDALFRQCGIYSSLGQLYEPVDTDSLLFYKEAMDGQILEEGITEAGAMSSFIASGTAHASQGLSTLPFFLFYSMFGFQRIGDLIWLAADSRCRGFLCGATAGRTTLAGEGLQHQDGHSHVLALPVPNLLAYDPAYSYEIAVIIRDGVRRMFIESEDIFYYLTIGNENYRQPEMPAGSEQGILRGAYRFLDAPADLKGPKVRLLGSGAILNEAVKARDLLAKDYGVAAEVYSITSYKALREDMLDCERWNRLHPDEAPRRSWLQETFGDDDTPIVAANDYMAALADMIARGLPGPLTSLGTEGFGRSDDRIALRDFFEVDQRWITHAALSSLVEHKGLDPKVARKALGELGLDPEKPNPAHV